MGDTLKKDNDDLPDKDPNMLSFFGPETWICWRWFVVLLRFIHHLKNLTLLVDFKTMDVINENGGETETTGHRSIEKWCKMRSVWGGSQKRSMDLSQVLLAWCDGLQYVFNFSPWILMIYPVTIIKWYFSSPGPGSQVFDYPSIGLCDRWNPDMKRATRTGKFLPDGITGWVGSSHAIIYLSCFLGKI